jgi:hypothetical protein
MNITISIRAPDHRIRISLSVLETRCAMGELNTLSKPKPHAPTFPVEAVEAPVEAAMVLPQGRVHKLPSTNSSQKGTIPTPVELESKPSTKSMSLFQWASANVIRHILQLLSIAAFFSLLLPYMRYSRARKATQQVICREKAQIMYDNSLLQGDVKAAKSLAGGAFGLR